MTEAPPTGTNYPPATAGTTGTDSPAKPAPPPMVAPPRMGHHQRHPTPVRLPNNRGRTMTTRGLHQP